MPTGIGSGIAGEVFTDEIGSGSRGGSTICPTRYSVNLNGLSQIGQETGTLLDLGTNNFSYSFWFKTSETSVQGIFSTDFNNTGVGLDIFLSASGILTATFDSVTFPTTASLNDGEWYHAVLSVDRSGDWKWYIDGINTNTLANPVGTAIFVGNYLWGNSFSTSFFNGNLTELSIWGTALSLSEVLTIYNNMFGSQTCLTDLTFSSGNLIQNGSFNEIGPQLIDNPTFNAPTSPNLVDNPNFTDTVDSALVNGDFATGLITPWSAAASGDGVVPVVEGSVGDYSVRIKNGAGGGGSQISQLSIFEVGKSYKVEYRILESNDTGGLSLEGYQTLDTSVTASGVYHTIYVVGGSTQCNFKRSGSNIDIVIADISVKELGADWTVIDGGGSVTFGDSFAEIIKTSTTPTFIQQDYPVTLGASHKLTYTVTENTLPSTTDELALSSASAYGYSPLDASASTTPKTVYLTVTDDTPIAALRLFSRGASGSIKITDISVQEVDWAFEGGWSLGSNKALATTAVVGDTLSQTGVFTLDKSYKTTFLSTLDSGNCFAEFGSDGFIGQLPSGTASNLFYYQTNEVGDSARIAFEVQSLMTGSISNVLTYQMDPNGYWNIPTANSTQLVLNPMFTNTGPEEVTNGDFSGTALGITLVTDGEFPSGTTAWTERGTSTINVGSATVEGLGALSSSRDNRGVEQPITISAGTSYKITFTAKQLTGTGVMYAGLGYTQPFSQVITSDYEVYTFDQVPANVSGSWPYICFGGAVGSTFEIKDVSVKEVLQLVTNGDFTDTGTDLVVDGDFPSGTTAWGFVNATLEIDGARIQNPDAVTNAYIIQGILGSPSGKSFVLTYDVISTNGALLAIEQANSISLDTSTTGTNRKLYFTWDRANDNLVIKRQSANLVDITIDNVRLEELGADWTAEGDSSISIGTHEGRDDVADININDTGTGSRISQPFTYVANKSYKVTVDVYVVSGSFRIDSSDTYVSGDFVSTTTTGSWQTLTGYITATASGSNYIWLRSMLDGAVGEVSEFYVDSVSIQELGEGWTLVGVNATNTITFESGGARVNSVDANISLRQDALEVGKSYKLTCDITETTGALALDGSVGGSTIILDEGFNEVYFTALIDTLKIKRYSVVSNVLIDNISVKETGLDWISPDAGTVNTFSATGLTMTSVNGAGYNNRIRQDNVTADDQAYKVEYTIVGSSLTAGNYLQFYNGATYVNMKTSVGTHILHFTRSGADDSVYLRLASNDGSLTDTVDIGSITIVEVQGWTLEDGKLVGDLPDLAKSATQDIGAIAGNSYKATMDVALAEEELITNGSFREVGADLVLAGDFPKPNVYWLKAASTTINGGSATFEGLGIASPYTGILNTYSGASAAYSLRLLDNTFSGSAIRVRRSSDNAEQNIGFVNNVLDTASLESFCSATNGYVTTWYDQSGSANNATNTTAADQPQIVSSGSTILENGKPAIKYDGLGDELEIGSQLNLGAEFFVPFVYKSNRTSSSDYVLSSVSPSSSRFRLYDYQARLYMNNVGYSFNSTNNHGTQYLWLSEADSSNDLIIYRNGSALGATQAIPSTDDFLINFVGYSGSASFMVDGLMQEIIFYPQDESSNRSGIQTNINDFYSIY